MAGARCLTAKANRIVSRSCSSVGDQTTTERSSPCSTALRKFASSPGATTSQASDSAGRAEVRSAGPSRGRGVAEEVGHLRPRRGLLAEVAEGVAVVFPAVRDLGVGILLGTVADRDLLRGATASQVAQGPQAPLHAAIFRPDRDPGPDHHEEDEHQADRRRRQLQGQDHLDQHRHGDRQDDVVRVREIRPGDGAHRLVAPGPARAIRHAQAEARSLGLAQGNKARIEAGTIT